MFYCMFYFTCDSSLTAPNGTELKTETLVLDRSLGVTSFQPVKEPIHFGGPGAAVRLTKLSLEVVEGVAFLLAVHLECVADVADVIK